jgi:hypothetical protein
VWNLLRKERCDCIGDYVYNKASRMAFFYSVIFNHLEQEMINLLEIQLQSIKKLPTLAVPEPMKGCELCRRAYDENVRDTFRDILLSKTEL